MPVSRSVATHQYAVTHVEAGMNDLVAKFRWHMLPRRRTGVGDHGFDLAAKSLLIELKCGLALAVECEIRIQLHSVLLWLETI
jgi:hypothetical protein